MLCANEIPSCPGSVLRNADDLARYPRRQSDRRSRSPSHTSRPHDDCNRNGCGCCAVGHRLRCSTCSPGPAASGSHRSRCQGSRGRPEPTGDVARPWPPCASLTARDDRKPFPGSWTVASPDRVEQSAADAHRIHGCRIQSDTARAGTRDSGRSRSAHSLGDPDTNEIWVPCNGLFVTSVGIRLESGVIDVVDTRLSFDVRADGPGIGILTVCREP